MYKKIGPMLLQLRKQADIQQKDLTRGILGDIELSRVEKGNKEIDRMHLEALFQRIGKSVDKLELAMSMDEYRLFALRFDILEALSVKNIEKAEDSLKEYETYIDKSKPLHLQALLLLQAVKSYIENSDIEKDANLFEKALEITFSEWEKAEFEDVCLCTQEIQLLLAILYIKLGMEGIQKNFLDLSEEEKHALIMLQKIYEYIDNRYTDEEERAKVYPQCAWIWSQVCLWRGDVRTAYEICQKGVDCLAENGVLTVMEELLEIKIKCLEKLGAVEGIQKIRKQKCAVAFLYDIVEKPRITEKIVLLFLTSIQGEVVVTNELIREMRLSRKMSQEELSADICAPETLSRIEYGKRSPNTKKLYRMFHKLGLERERYYGFIVADDYGLYEKVRLYKRIFGKGKIEKAEQVLEELSTELDSKYVINKQFIDTGRVLIKLKKKEISNECAYEELRKILSYTMKDYVDTVYRVPFRQEVVILNQMANCLRRTKKEELAIEIYEQILNRYDSSMVYKIFHSVSDFLIYISYTALLEEKDYLDKSEEIGKEGISLMINCQRGDISGKILANLSCVYEKRDTKKDVELAQNCLGNSYYLLDLYLHEHNKAILKAAYEKMYHTLLD